MSCCCSRSSVSFLNTAKTSLRMRLGGGALELLGVHLEMCRFVLRINLFYPLLVKKQIKLEQHKTEQKTTTTNKQTY